MLLLFIFPFKFFSGHQSSYQTKHKTFVWSWWICSQRTSESHFSFVWCHENKCHRGSDIVLHFRTVQSPLFALLFGVTLYIPLLFFSAVVYTHVPNPYIKSEQFFPSLLGLSRIKFKSRLIWYLVKGRYYYIHQLKACTRIECFCTSLFSWLAFRTMNWQFLSSEYYMFFHF